MNTGWELGEDVRFAIIEKISKIAIDSYRSYRDEDRLRQDELWADAIADGRAHVR